jgi:hypothetical protein
MKTPPIPRLRDAGCAMATCPQGLLASGCKMAAGGRLSQRPPLAKAASSERSLARPAPSWRPGATARIFDGMRNGDVPRSLLASGCEMAT